jgi:DNA-binding Lrp family transcriptional regulator
LTEENIMTPEVLNCGISLKLSLNEWKVLYYAPTSNTLSKISEQAKLPYSTVIDIIRRLQESKISMHFVPNLGLMGLKYVFLLFPGPPFREYPLYTLRVYRLIGKQIFPGMTGLYTGVLGLVPESQVSNYVKSFGMQPEFQIVGDEYKHWTPNGKLTRYDTALGVVVPDIENIDDAILTSMSPIIRHERKWIDWIDLLIVYFKMKYAYTKLSEVHSSIRRVFGIDPPSRQLMSYHYRSHVAPLWTYNSVSYELPKTSVPEKIYIFKGPHSKVITRTLVEAPFFLEGLYSEDTGLVVGQPPSYVEPIFYTVLSKVNVEMPIGILLVEKLWNFEWLTQDAVKYYKENTEYADPSIQRIKFEEK